MVPAQSRRSLQQGPLRRDATTTSFLWLSGTTSEHRYWSDTSPPIGRSRLPSGQRDRPPPTEKEEGPQSCGPPLRTRGAQHQFRHVGATTTPAPAHPPRAATTCLPVAAQARARPPAERPVHGLLIADRTARLLPVSGPNGQCQQHPASQPAAPVPTNQSAHPSDRAGSCGHRRSVADFTRPLLEARNQALKEREWTRVSVFHTKKSEAGRAVERGRHQLSSWPLQSEWMGGLEVSLAGAARKTLIVASRRPSSGPTCLAYGSTWKHRGVGVRARVGARHQPVRRKWALRGVAVFMGLRAHRRGLGHRIAAVQAHPSPIVLAAGSTGPDAICPIIGAR